MIRFVSRPFWLRLKRRDTPVFALLPRPLWQHGYGGTGWIAGEGTGLVTVGNPPKPAARLIVVQVRNNLHAGIIRSTWSKADGTYRIHHLDPARWYVVTVLDNHHKHHGSPFAPYSAVVKPFVDTP